MHKRAISRLTSRTFFVSQYQKTSWGALLCFTTFGYFRVLCTKRVQHDSLSKIVCLTGLRVSVGEPFTVWLFSDKPKKFMKNKDISQYFLTKCFCLTLPKNTVRNHSVFHFFGTSKNLHTVVVHHDFLSKIFCLTVRNSFVVEHFSVSESFGQQKILRSGVWLSWFSVVFSCLTVPKNFVG